eukprot:gnl/TRDRNA2_/TRDRNA2_174258_c0_seq1.p1 gnl/TRDRNA2_/TRDRNA2_174258_c0~~gnl/TRDRNA2_/TRDRNA2_174258_c0_seq1.p1  ORF type:complete len:231 (-),score=56.75 gnl/TRDRNA2_/TRDRNA2_174258_c0_seq1:381-1073(-)
MACYTAAEVAQMQSIFKSYDKDGNGDLEHRELRSMISRYFPEATRSRAQQKEMLELLNEVDTDGSKTIDFNEFLWLMRKCDDMRDAVDVQLEMQVAKDLEITAEEVEGFRQIFSTNVNWCGELDIESLTKLLNSIMELSEEESLALVTTVQELHPDGRDVARFPQFLKLVHKLTQDNALGINDAATRVVRRADLKSGKRSVVAATAANANNLAQKLDLKPPASPDPKSAS